MQTKLDDWNSRKQKASRLLASINFLKRCRDHNIIPNCVRLAPRKDIVGSASILETASRKLLIKLVAGHRTEYQRLNIQIQNETEEIREILSEIDWRQCINILNTRAHNKFNNCKVIQIKKKFEKLAQNTNRHLSNVATLNDTPDTSQNVTVIYLSKQNLYKQTIEVLNKGLILQQHREKSLTKEFSRRLSRS
ncbi:unnamed protein product [Pieris macdunnoughi]|uniref:Uncharacterized protein n=1 Tax=Pieris macdunnoughi TaxID=345717 RepID=A0A821W856_9NEOP|nr:unnamed protein product [Pieris macdunnoughi]